MVSVPEGSTREVQFTVTSNPPLPENIKHKLSYINVGVEVPATRRFIVTDSTINLNDVTPKDAGLYQISCKDKNGHIGKEIFELKVLCK